MGHLHLIGGEKGGVGKSFTTRLLAQYYIDKQKQFVGFDTDQSHQTFSRFYGEFTKRLRVDDYDSLDQIIGSAEDQPQRDIIVDLAAQTSGRLVLWMEDTELFKLMKELGFTTHIWHVMDDGADSIRLLSRQLQRYRSASVEFVIVLNEGRGEDFTFFEESEAYRWALDQGAHIVELSRLQTNLARKIDFLNASFWAAANNKGSLTTAERQRVRTWLKWQYFRLDGIFKQESEKAVGTASSELNF